MSLDSIGGFLGENTQEPALLEFTKEGVFNQAAQVIEVDDRQWIGDRQAGQEDLGLIGGINMSFELRDDDGVDGVAFEIGNVKKIVYSLAPLQFFPGSASGKNYLS